MQESDRVAQINRIVLMLLPNSGCTLLGSFGDNVNAFISLAESSNNVCDGCAYNKKGFNACGFHKHEAKIELLKRSGLYDDIVDYKVAVLNRMTNADLAKKHGISKRQASKIRRKGTLVGDHYGYQKTNVRL